MKDEKLPKFESVSCSNCAQDFGPGNHGYSHCESHSGRGTCKPGDLCELCVEIAERQVLADLKLKYPDKSGKDYRRQMSDNEYENRWMDRQR